MKPSLYTLGWLVVVGTEQDAGHYIVKHMQVDKEGKITQRMVEVAPEGYNNTVTRRSVQMLLDAVAVLSIAREHDPIAGVGAKLSDDVYWVEGSYAKTQL